MTERKTAVWTRKPSNPLARLTRAKTRYEIGEMVGNFKLARFVGDNPDALYLIFQCPCGRELAPRARKNVTQLKKSKSCLECKRQRDRVAQTERERVKRELRRSAGVVDSRCES